MAGLAAQLAFRLRRRFACAGLRPGDQLPSVRAIEEEFHASRTVVTEAMDLLEHEGVVVRHHGRGSYLERVPTLVDAGVHSALVVTVDLPPLDSYLELLLNGLSEGALQQQCRLAVRRCGGDGGGLAEVIAGSATDGLILVGEVTPPVLAIATATGLPCVVASGTVESALAIGASWLGHDDREGAYQATQHLIALGRQRILWLGGPADLPHNRERLAGHADALADAGRRSVPELLHHSSRNSPLLAALQEALGSANPPDAVMLSGDYLAQPVYEVIAGHGLQIGQGCSVMGFDDLADAASLEPPLTTMRAEIELLGRESLRLLLRRIAGGPSETLVIPRRLVRRRSTAPARSA